VRARRPRQRAEDHVFDPVLVGHRECDAWVAYYRRDWARLMVASVGLVSAGFGMGRARTVAGAWHVFRANRSWSPYPDNHPAAARRSMERFYALVATTGGVSIDAAHAAHLEVEWWRLHRERQHDLPVDSGQVVSALARLYAYANGVPQETVRDAARWRVRAMDLSDRWVAGGRRRDDPLLELERQALVRSHTALRDAVSAGSAAHAGNDDSDVNASNDVTGVDTSRPMPCGEAGALRTARFQGQGPPG
jgi:hypothetical protein